MTKLTPSSVASARHERLLSLDVLRGITVGVMILVNNAGDSDHSYAQLTHSRWNGCTLTDLVFPLFLFIVGASIDLAFQRRLAQGVARGTILRQVLRRSLLIFAVGLLLNALPYFHLGELRYYGVLQRIALCYALASLVYLYGGVAASAVVTTLALVGYWWLMVHVRVPGYGMPGVGVGVLDRGGNLAAWLDRTLVPTAHLYRHTVYDPEGLLSTVPAVATTLLGVLAASVLGSARSANRKTVMLVVAGMALLCGGLVWSHWFPLNKRLWTSSYVLFAGGISTTLLAALYWVIDGPPRLRRGLTPWLVLGTNALTAYVVSEVLSIALTGIVFADEDTLQEHIYQLLPTVGSAAFTSLIYSVLFVVVCALPVAYLYRRKIFVKL